MLGEEIEGMAWMPDYYPVIKAARYLGVPPWELLEQSIYWRDKALIVQAAEDQAKAERQRRNQG